MKKNESTTDRVARLALALVAAIAAVVVGTTVWGVMLWVVAAVLVVTAVAGFCPIYRVLGWSTRSDLNS